MQRALVSPEGKGWQALDADAVHAAGLRWVDVQDATEEEFRRLEHEFKFHPLAVEDCRHLDQRSKLEEYADHVFIVLHVYTEHGAGPTELTLQELHIFLRPDLLVTVHKAPMAAITHVWERALKGDVVTSRSPGAAFMAIADAMVDQMFPSIDALVDATEDLAEAILDNPRPVHLNRIHAIKRAVMEIRRLTGPAREVVTTLTRVPVHGVTEHDALYFRNVADHLHVLAQQVDLCRELVADTRDLYLSAQGSRVNEIAKRLSVLATLALPLTFITGFFGMNFTMMPFDDKRLLFVGLAAMLLVPAGLLAFLRWRDWV